MPKIKENHERLHSINWNDFLSYDESSKTCLKWKSETRPGRGGYPVKRKSMEAGGSNSEGYLVFTYEKYTYSIPKIVWVMHNGPIPDGFSVWFLDNDCKNAKISNLYVKETSPELTEKYSEEIKKYLEYDESSPSCLRWKQKSSKSSSILVGSVAGSLDTSDGYWKLHGLGYHYKIHRIIWFMHHGKIPKGYHIDHIDRNRDNNKISNLRAVPPSINGKNRSRNKNNVTGENNIAYNEFFNKNGTLIRRYSLVISWNGNQYRRAFSLNKYGDELAWKLAIEAKKKFLEKLEAQGIGFTEDHGT